MDRNFHSIVDIISMDFFYIFFLSYVCVCFYTQKKVPSKQSLHQYILLVLHVVLKDIVYVQIYVSSLRGNIVLVMEIWLPSSE